MDIGVYILGCIILTFTIIFGMFDMNLNNSMKQNLFESVRATNQNALFALQDDYNNLRQLTTPRMLEEWLIAFAKNRDLSYTDLVVNFVQIENEPPLYLVYVEGYKEQYAILSEEAYAAYYSGSTLITK